MTMKSPAKGGCWRIDEVTGDLVADVAAPDVAAPDVAAPAPTETPPPPAQTGLMDEEESY